MKNKFSILKTICFVALAIAFLFGLSWVVMQLWNFAVVAAISAANPISYQQALALLVICKILFGGFKPPFSPKYRCKESQMLDKWSALTPEEKEAFKDEWKNKCRTWKFMNGK